MAKEALISSSPLDDVRPHGARHTADGTGHKEQMPRHRLDRALERGPVFASHDTVERVGAAIGEAVTAFARRPDGESERRTPHHDR
ncbi:MAG: hypothetical protein EA355_10155 [Rhodobacteraceae bacterium]|nr:MAG: hypothetical protein EA355_10155 [Paracoccaceae bacterium]